MLLNGPFFGTFQTLACGVGIVAFAYYAKKGCDPLRAGYIGNANQVNHDLFCAIISNLLTQLIVKIRNYIYGEGGLALCVKDEKILTRFSCGINKFYKTNWG